ncbi:MAG TPA: RNA polymerase factor sigma-32 [Acidobacteriota bacterium]
MSAARRKSGAAGKASPSETGSGKRRGRKRRDPPAGSETLPVEILGPEAEAIDSDLLPEAGSSAGDSQSAAAEASSLATYDPLRRYIAEIRQYPQLGAEEERELAIRYRRHGDLAAARLLVTANLRLVVKMARMFHRWRLNILDLIQEGNLGLLQAVQRFDPFRGLRLSTYAYWWIKAYILKYVMDNWGLVRIGTTAARRRLLYNLSREQRLLEARGIEAGPKLLAERFGVSEEDVKDVSAGLGQRDVSLDAPVDSEAGGMAFVDALPSAGASVEESVAQDEMQELMQRKFQAFAGDLDPRDRAILEHRLLASEPMTLEQIGQQFGITREGVRQVERKLLVRLKAFMERELKERGFSFQLQRRHRGGG